MSKALLIATAMVRSLQDAGFFAAFCGGAVRDMLLGIQPNDYDVVTNARPEQVLALFKDDGAILAGQNFGVVIVVRDGVQIEIATFRGDGVYSDGRHPDTVTLLSDLSPEDGMRADSARRDSTINAMYYDPIADKVYDYVGGEADIKAKVMRAVGEPLARITEDPVRTLRFIRQANAFGLTIEDNLMAALQNHGALLDMGGAVPWERVPKELKGILLSKTPGRGMQLLMDSSLLQYILPELMDMVGENAVQDPLWHPEGNAWTHTKMVLDVVAENADEEKDFALMLGVLLHDIAKPVTMAKHPQVIDGVEVVRVSNKGHAEKGAVMARAICNRLRLSAEVTNRVSEIVRMHMQMHDFHRPEIKRSKLVRLLQRPDIHDLIKMQHGDVMGTGRTAAERQASSNRAFYLGKLSELAAASTPSQKLGADALVDGRLIKEMGFKNGPIFRVIKESAFDAQHEGLFTDVEGARAWLTAKAEEFRSMSVQDIAAFLNEEDAKYCC